MILDCRCGQKLNTPGAVPGRVGKCPRCGALLKIEDDRIPEPAAPGETYQRPRTVRRPLAARKRARRDGLVVVPTRPERTLLASGSYPLRNASGIALLVMLPPMLWFGSILLISAVPMIISASPFTLFGLLMLVPALGVLFVGIGPVLLFLGDVVVTSCLGEVQLPRPAGWSLTDISQGWGRWIWAGVFGGALGAMPALVYWIHCGDVDWLDQLVLMDLILPGLASAQMAVVVALLHESPWAVGYPVLVIRMIVAGGWGYVGPCVVTASCLTLLAGISKWALEQNIPGVFVVVLWFWWVLALYLAMVALRFLGLFCGRQRLLSVGIARRP